MRPHVRLRTRIAAIVLLGAVVVAVGVALLLGNAVDMRRATTSAIGAEGYVQSVADVERLVVDAETGLRGFLLTGKAFFLQPLHSAQANLPQAANALRQAAAQDGSYQERAEALIVAASLYMSQYVQRELELASRNLSAAKSLAATARGKQLVDAIRARTATLERLVAVRQSARQLAAHRTADDSIDEAVVLLIVLTGLTLLVGGYLGHLTVQRELVREEAVATSETLQRSLLPNRIPQIPRCELAVRFLPQGGLVGGDFYDVYPTAPDTWVVFLGDVCGKGAEAAAVSAMARWTLRSLGEGPVTPVDALRFLNERLLRQELFDRYITLAYLHVTLQEERARVTVACAGHPPPIRVPAVGEPESVPASGHLLGIWPDIRVAQAELDLGPGDSVLVYSDGVTDQGPRAAPSPEAVLRQRVPDASAEQLAGALQDLAQAPKGAQRDDIAILALRFSGRGSEGAGGYDKPPQTLSIEPVPAI